MMAKHGFLKSTDPLNALYDHFEKNSDFAVYMVREYFAEKTYLQPFTNID
jgi:hypothetical protein